MPLRVLVVGPAPAGPLSRGGMATVTAAMLRHPDDAFAVTAVPTFVDGTVAQRLWVGVTGMLRAAWLVVCGRADVLHVHLSHGGSVIRKSLPLLAARAAGVPAVVHGHSYDFGGWFDRIPAPVRAAVRAVLPADRWVVLGSPQAGEYAARLQLPDERIAVLHNAVHVPSVPVEQRAHEVLHVVSVGRLGERKGSYDLVAAVGALDESGRGRLRVTLAGDGDTAEVTAAIDAAGLSGTVAVAGWLDEAARDELLRGAHIFALPSYDEGLPMALLEAMAHGLVPVTTPVGSIAEVVDDGTDGLLVSPGRPEEIAAALTALAADERLRVRLAAAARERAARFGIDQWYRRLAQLWLELSAATLSPR